MSLSNLFSELSEYFKEKYFSPDLGDLQYLDGDSAVRFLPLCVVGICAGIFIAALIYYYNAQFLGKTVRKLYAADAFSPAKAKTLDEIGCNKRAVCRNLRRDTVLSKYVVPVEPLQHKADVELARFYIPEEKRLAAIKRYKEVRGGLRSLLLLFVLCTALCFFLLYYAPDAVRLADNAIGLFL